MTSPTAWTPRPTTLDDDLRCGYVTQAALDEVDALPPDAARRLAAMVVTHHENRWSDARRDLFRGVSNVLSRLPVLDRDREGGR